jgi:hypothetical protein
VVDYNPALLYLEGKEKCFVQSCWKALLRILRLNPKKNMVYGPYAGADYNLILCPIQSRLHHIYHWQPYARIDLNHLPESTLSSSQGLWIWPRFSGKSSLIRFLSVFYLPDCA